MALSGVQVQKLEKDMTRLWRTALLTKFGDDRNLGDMFRTCPEALRSFARTQEYKDCRDIINAINGILRGFDVLDKEFRPNDVQVPPDSVPVAQAAAGDVAGGLLPLVMLKKPPPKSPQAVKKKTKDAVPPMESPVQLFLVYPQLWVALAPFLGINLESPDDADSTPYLQHWLLGVPDASSAFDRVDGARHWSWALLYDFLASAGDCGLGPHGELVRAWLLGKSRFHSL